MRKTNRGLTPVATKETADDLEGTGFIFKNGVIYAKNNPYSGILNQPIRFDGPAFGNAAAAERMRIIAVESGKRMRALLLNLGCDPDDRSQYTSALYELACRHVPGFRIDVRPRRAGRPSGKGSLQTKIDEALVRRYISEGISDTDIARKLQRQPKFNGNGLSSLRRAVAAIRNKAPE